MLSPENCFLGSLDQGKMPLVVSVENRRAAVAGGASGVRSGAERQF